MARFLYCFLFLLCCFSFCRAEATSTPTLVNGVQLCDKPLYDVENHYYGGDLYVINSNSYAVYTSVELVRQVNVRNNLKKDIIVLGPYDQAYVGRVQQADLNKSWSYHAQLYAIPIDSKKSFK